MYSLCERVYDCAEELRLANLLAFSVFLPWGALDSSLSFCFLFLCHFLFFLVPYTVCQSLICEHVFLWVPVHIKVTRRAKRKESCKSLISKSRSIVSCFFAVFFFNLSCKSLSMILVLINILQDLKRCTLEMRLGKKLQKTPNRPFVSAGLQSRYAFEVETPQNFENWFTRQTHLFIG